MSMYLRPRTLEEACEALAKGPVRILAGGTDVYPSLVDRPQTEQLLDISRLSGLEGITASRDEIRIGGRTTWSSIARRRAAALLRRPEAGGARGRRHPDPERRHDRRQSLQRVAGRRRRAAAPRPRRRGGAGLASPARGACRSPPSSWATAGPRAGPARSLTAVLVPRSIEHGALRLPQARRAPLSRHLDRHGGRHRGGGRARAGRRRRGSRSAPARRSRSASPALERALVGQPARPGLGAGRRSRASRRACRPIDDVRASAGYRRDAARTLVARALEAVVAER